MPARLAEVLGFVAANVRRLRIRRGLTQEALAERAGIDLTTEQRIERGATNLTLAVLVALAESLEVAPGLLLRAAKVVPVPRGRPRKR
jgi:transcriptional regulator with XRE-family HTH domain